VNFVGLGWEDTLASTGRRSQALINREIDGCDVFVLALNRRWGQEAPDAKPYTSYTEEEFHRAMDRWKNTGSPEIFVFFKHVDTASMADPGEQLKKVLAFRKSLEDSRHVLYRFFADDKEFTAEVNRHLRAYAKGELPKADAPREALLLPLEYVQAVEQEKLERQQAVQRADREHQQAEAANARAEVFALEFAQRAASAALEGKIEEARQDFAKALDGTTNLDVFSLGYEFFSRIGELDEAERLLRRWLALSGPDAQSAETAAAYGNLGLIYQWRGDLDRAEEMHRKSLAIHEKLGRQEGMADNYGNLGLIYETRGDLDRAEEMLRKSLAIDERLGIQEGIASASCNLGLIYDTRGNLDRAEAMHRKALAINKKLGNQEGMAAAYSNLGLIYQTRGDLDRAEEMHRKALASHEKLGLLKGMAIQCFNLAHVREKRGDIAAARELFTRSRDLYARVGIKQWTENAQRRLDALPG
jgi:tetratricopeptide (TPR) repeat protein